MKFIQKKGLSPIIATILLIALAMILAMIIFLWARGFISEQIEKRGTPIDRVCEQAKIEVSYSPGSPGKLIVSNKGSFPIHAIEVRYISEDGSSTSNTFPADIMQFDSKIFDLPSYSNLKKIIVYPQMLGTISGKADHRERTCVDNGEVIDL